MARTPGFVSLLALSVLGCANHGSAATPAPPPTLIQVDPTEFADNVACNAGAESMQVYVATLIDVTGDYDGSVPALQSSPPTACDRVVGFGFVAPGRKYQAQIDAYDRSDLEPLTPGSPVMKVSHGETTTLVDPHWTASCGVERAPAKDLAQDAGTKDAGAEGLGSSTDPSFLTGPAEAFENETVTVRGCTRFIE